MNAMPNDRLANWRVHWTTPRGASCEGFTSYQPALDLWQAVRDAPLGAVNVAEFQERDNDMPNGWRMLAGLFGPNQRS